ncbi:D-alanyl-D-alanine carboxypeptidase [Streptomyces justiciae]|uniref:serine-type D-Ala-D-Ala carboxypeptidase n=1 Tax=Streptomyces justiciae TaxID=2780140 RepID=A0ABU3LLB8_9ACTN|nr:D-alanyl-D-alanine carboxypeptidase [Streptomyces justiciae]MDT7839347.1 D-alanyl-D-alanine carboxypeptidase [Streptomyces justiciae]
MAGEFPDRSKQRESSAEPTPGSAGPVPEARTETRDPRLAVARDTDGPGTESGGGVDTATRVFSVRDVAKARESAARAETGAAGDSGDAGGAGVSGGSERAEGSAGSGDAGRSGVAAGSAGAEGSGGSRSGDAGASDAEDGQERPGTDAEDAEAQDAGAQDAEAPEAEGSQAEGREGAASEDTGGDARLRAAVAAWVRSGDGTPDESESGAEADTDADDGTEPGDESDADVENAAAEADGGAETAKGPQEAPQAAGEPETDAEAPGAADTGKPADGSAKAGTERDAGSKAAERDVDEPETAASTAPEERTQPEDASTPTDAPHAADGTTEPTDDRHDAQAATASAGPPDEPRDAYAAAEPADDRRDAQAATASAGSADEPRDVRGGTEPADAAEAPRPTDASTRLLKAVAPGDKPGGAVPKADPRAAADAPRSAEGEKAPGAPAPGDDSRTSGAGGKKTGAGGEAEAERPVDQPTTMLKLPPAAERTSKFVALKPDVTTPVPQIGPERTTQQPLPPKPPLDLLAELTNTPPPPETPLRTTVRRVKIWTPLVLLLAIVFAVVQSVRPLPTPTLQLTAEDSYSFDGGKVDIPWPSDGQAALDVQGIGSFGSSGEQKPVPIASVAKVMTAYLILRDHPLKSGAKGPNIKIDQTAQDQADAGQESTVDVTAGDSISQREALESILIASANNVARLLARWDAGSEKAFVEKMNDAADDLGMTNTTYTDPSGLNNTTVSTAVDQVKLAKKAMEYPAFREVAAMMSYDDYKGTNHPNWNQLVGKNDVVGIKTGTTTSALGNLVFAAKKEVNGETRTIVGAVLRQPAGGVDNTILSAALTAGDQLIRAAQGALKSATIIKKGDVVGYVDDGLGGHTAVVATKDVTAVGWSGLTVKLTFAADDVPHTAKAGTKVGTLTVGDASAGAVSVPVALQEDLVEPGFTDKLTRVS